MVNRKAARRYTTELYGLAEELKLVDNVKKDFEDVKKSIAGSRELDMFIKSPVGRLRMRRCSFWYGIALLLGVRFSFGSCNCLNSGLSAANTASCDAAHFLEARIKSCNLL